MPTSRTNPKHASSDDRYHTDSGAGDEARWDATARHFADVAVDWVDRYENRRSFRQRLHIVGDIVESVLATRETPTVLDLGGGPGIFSVLCARHGGSVIDLDPSVSMLMAGREGIPRMTRLIDSALPARRAPRPGAVRFVAGTLDALSPAADGRFDLVLAIAVLEYVDDPRATLGRLARLLTPGGAIILTAPRDTSLPRRAERALTPLAQSAQRATRKTDAWRRLRDRAYTDLRPHGDRVPWRPSLAAAGLAVTVTRPVPLGDRLPWRRLAPNEVVILRRVDDAAVDAARTAPAAAFS